MFLRVLLLAKEEKENRLVEVLQRVEVVKKKIP